MSRALVPIRTARAALVGLVLLLTVPDPAAAGFDCDGIPAASQPTALARCNEVLAAASFAADGSARDAILGPGLAAFGDVLPPSHETPGVYEESVLDGAIAWAREAPRSVYKEEILFEASFRKASAHGMFGDDRLVRALNAALDPSPPGGFLGDPVHDALVKLDSRVCRAPGPAGPLLPSAPICQTAADCASGGQICAPTREGDAASGLFGAVQEYRRGERVLVEAIQFLGVARFQAIDRSGPVATSLGAWDDCGGVGCASRLLVRLGALRARAVAERVDALWRRAVATGGVLEGATRCTAGDVGSLCRLDRDCGPGGRCGGSEKERAFVLVRTAAAEALAEANVAMSLYAHVVPTASDGSDLGLLQSSLLEIAELESRSASSSTPFGLPADYVPFLSGAQRDLLDCGSGVSVFECLENLLTSQTVGLLASCQEPQNRATLQLDAFADAVRERSTFVSQMSQSYEDVLARMFGTSCESLGCTCSPADAAAGICVEFAGRVWVVEGIVCDDPDDPFTSCTVGQQVDGEIERQIQAELSAELALFNLGERIERNSETYAQTLAKFAALAGIRAEECAAVQAAILASGVAISNAIQDRRADVTGVTNEQLGLAAAQGAVARSSQVAAAGPYAILIGAAVGAAEGFFGAKWAGDAAEDERKEDLDLQRALAAIEAATQVELNRIQCAATQQVLDVELQDALFQVETERLLLFAQAREQQRAIIDAQIAANQLLAELRRARQRYEEAGELLAIWDSASFRNPQNYRALALRNQLQAADAFRTAQMVTWFLLRATAYDLGRPDFFTPQRFGPGETIQISSCSRAVCLDDATGAQVGGACIADADCAPGQSCGLSDQSSPIADSNGNCSLQAVFAARTCEDLTGLLRSAFLAEVEPFRSAACSGECTKVVSLRNIFTDASDPGQPPLGQVLAPLPLTDGNVAVLEFGITAKRGFNVCPLLPDFSLDCQPEGVASMSAGESGPGDNTPDVWNARVSRIKGVVRFAVQQEPNAKLCRDPSTGAPVGANPAFACITTPIGGECPGECSGPLGNPTPCRCARILNGEPLVDLVQAGPGLVRTRLAEASDLPDARDSFLSYAIRKGDLPLDLGSSPALVPFAVRNLGLAEDQNLAQFDESAAGIPVASSRWQLRIKPTGLQGSEPIVMRELLRSIDDIELHIVYEGFNLD